ncbi:MAG TPA: hypothetical protein VHZ78_01540 [Rhizomicrobium sp.]|jgi:cobaltochelatase CobT|nr:hypothetical protein [Rhizomicrobium sp.]
MTAKDTYPSWFSGLFSRPARDAEPTEPAPGYRIYTTQFDIEATGNTVQELAAKQTDAGAFRRNVALFDAAMQDWRVAAGLAGMASLERLSRARDGRPLENTVVSLLVDHSGSMRGQRAIYVLALVELLTDHLLRLGARVEVLGYTTRSWHGGLSRKAWIKAGQPKNPGRLCDLLHIVYRDADESIPFAGWALRNLLRDDLLKENIDGEAVLWAGARLRRRPEKRKILIGISDGAPVDDSTLMENGPHILDNHMREVIAELAAAGDIEALGIGIDYDLTRYYRSFVQVSSIADYADRLLPFLEAAFASKPEP